MKIIEKQFAVIFKHPEGWTISAVLPSKGAAEIELRNSKDVAPDFEYRIVPVSIEFNVVKP